MLNSMLIAGPVYTVRPRQTQALRLVTSPARPQVLLICDLARKAAEWQAAWREANVVSLTDLADLTRFAGQRFVLAVLDVAPAKLVDALKTIRMSAEQSDLPILVKANAVMGDLSFAGVLPQFRAMACEQSELIQLVFRRLTGTTPRNVRR